MSSPDDDDRNLFAGVRFVLLGFDSVSESQYRAEMVRRGGADAGRLGGACTHVVACGRVYDDPVCVAARAQGHKVVSELWVDDSLDRAVLADADRVIYWPTRDLKGIPGSDELRICLTGYQRNDREDIMKMVALMGAHFSKPLVGGVVTHLVCYKFEGEKYDLAKKVKIKLTNHRWLEDCLKSWEILPVGDYSKSSWELEMMEAQVKDSDDEVEDVDRKPFNSRSSVKCTPNPKNSMRTSGNPGVDAQICPPIIPNDDKNMAVDRHLNTPSQIKKEGNMIKKTHDIRAQLQGTPNFSRLASSANTDSGAPIQTAFVKSGNRVEAAVRNLNSPNQVHAAEYEFVNTSGQIREENMVKKTHDITAQLQASPNFSRFASSADTDSGAPIQPPFVTSGNREEAAVRNLNNPNQVQVAEYKDVGTGIAAGAPGAPSSSDIATGAPGTPSSSTMAVPANHHFHSSNDTLMVPKNTATPRARKTGARRPCSASIEVDGSVVNNGKAVVSESETDKIIPCQQAGTIPKDGSSIASATEREITSLKKVPVGTPSSSRMPVPANHHFSSSNETLTVPKTKATPRARNAGAKRPHSDSMEVDGLVVNNVKAVVSESETEKMLPCQLASATSKKGSSSASVTEQKTTSSKKVPFGGVRSAHAKRQQSVHIEVNDAQVGSELELNKVIPQENIETSPKRFCSSARDAEHERKSPKKLPNTRVKSTVAKKSRKSDTNMAVESPADKAEKVTAESLFDDFFPSANVEDCPKKLSSSASADGCDTVSPENVSKTRVRKVVAKRKAVEDKSGSKHNIMGSAIVSAAKAFSSKRMESTCNIDEVTAHQDSQKGNNDAMRDVSVLSCKDTVTVDKSEGMHKSKLRCSERNKAPASDHDKENQRDDGNLSSKLDCVKGGSNSKFALRCSARNKAPASEHDKENRQDPVNLSSKSDCGNRGLNSKFDLESTKKNTDMLDKHGGREGNGAGTFITLDPTCFILSGHRWQRRDYRSILRRLKGRVCRDSHHWSYQATHFIAPDPLRRTEKFFAAAAAGRWILKPDYLTSCNEAGKLLDEGPFEWSGTGLNEGETIGFEAPRKWRVIKQQMGHGAFYGMQIIVYGQLIAPSLDTVKRAVRAGDGNILATSPPYTRFLNSGVDFAVISASMPSADAWVQEFVSHNIPCVSADYLVEYVCKPGYPLDRHVLFKTNRLANKSLGKLLKNQQEVATDDLEELEDDDPADDLSCSVCGSTDRGEVMLICGSEDGSVGCGAGMHIDCCDPPLECVPDDDWLCPKCDLSKAKKKSAAPSKSRGSKRRR
ncbi:hypothetical protein QYE76_020053 [Lolium multiflorum]|uniref:BRCT domain-containing protein n=1 Tax=Lolium multiflorum TaxID=4521 RepID=A0AAD8R552_LOLMU|nr:hypothetical protein QYE76_020053 [Lolium multiflorum]